METAPAQYWAALGVGGVLAAMIFHFYRKDIRQYTELWKSQSEILIGALRDNTSAMTTMVELLKALHHRLDVDPAPDTSLRRRAGGLRNTIDQDDHGEANHARTDQTY